MITSIPARQLVTCDGCGKECGLGDRRQSGVLKVDQDALDYQGSPCANGSTKFDLCDGCLNHLVKVINTELKALRHE